MRWFGPTPKAKEKDGKGLYLIPQKIPPKRFARFRAYHAYLWLALGFKDFKEMIL